MKNKTTIITISNNIGYINKLLSSDNVSVLFNAQKRMLGDKSLYDVIDIVDFEKTIILHDERKTNIHMCEYYDKYSNSLEITLELI